MDVKLAWLPILKTVGVVGLPVMFKMQLLFVWEVCVLWEVAIKVMVIATISRQTGARSI